ncbi:MAG: hypothetical protein QXQ14_00495 [Candidatus Aenigmatarchaeota archaeon]
MLTKLLNLFISGRVKVENGKYRIFDEFWVFLNSKFLADLTMLAFKHSTVPAIYLISWINGFIIVNKMIKELKIENQPDKIYRLGMDFASILGYGLYKTHYYSFQKFTYFEIDSPIADYIKKEWNFEAKKLRNVDIIAAGFMAGGGSLVHKQVVQTLEIECKVNNKPKCIFLTMSEDYAKEKGLINEIEKRYNLKEIYPIQKYVFENYDKNPNQTLSYANQIISNKFFPTSRPLEEIII